MASVDFYYSEGRILEQFLRLGWQRRFLIGLPVPFAVFPAEAGIQGRVFHGAFRRWRNARVHDMAGRVLRALDSRLRGNDGRRGGACGRWMPAFAGKTAGGGVAGDGVGLWSAPRFRCFVGGACCETGRD
jgi:hypothetical protein